MKITKRYKACLFDMDGTIISSVAAAERVWSDWARSHGVNVETFLPTIHGSRAIDTISRLNLPGIDLMAEVEAVTQGEIAMTEGIVEIPGAKAFLKSLPTDKWAIVTSCPVPLALARLNAAGMPIPDMLITAEDVSKGKPDPEGYKLAALRLNVDIKDCVVFEDAEVGMKAAEAAEADLIVVTATHRHAISSHYTAIASYEDLGVSIDATGSVVIAREEAATPAE